jgi:hypothetical protein
MFLGAGASKAAGLPLTEELLEHIYPRRPPAVWHSVHSGTAWARLLSTALKVLYPAGDANGFRPSVADFFTVLEVVATVHANRERLPLDALTLVGDLRTEIARGLHDQLDDLAIDTSPHYAWFTSDQYPQVVVTSNWDTMAERAALLAGRTVRLLWPRDTRDRRITALRRGEVVILKLHGSIDWGTYATRSVLKTPLAEFYSALETAVRKRTAFERATKPADLPLRFRSLEDKRDGQGKRVGFAPPLMATMAVGKQAQIDLLGTVWDDAYWCLSRAATLGVVGYSFPPDDLELRTLLRMTTRRAGQATLDSTLALTMCNPSPESHDRGRHFLGDPITSDYRGADAWAP